MDIGEPEIRALGEWLEFECKLRSASEREILSLMSRVVMYLEDKLNDETLPSYDSKEYVHEYDLEAAGAELAKRHSSERLGLE